MTRVPYARSAPFVIACAALVLAGWSTLRSLFHVCLSDPNTSHGLLVPLVAGYLALQRRPRLPEVSGEHGRQLPTGEYGMGDMHGLFVMNGPGVKRGLRLERTVWLTDITPTLCYLMGLPVPNEAEGAIIYQALQDPEAHRAELAELQKNYQRLKAAYGADKSLAHSYEHGDQ